MEMGALKKDSFVMAPQNLLNVGFDFQLDFNVVLLQFWSLLDVHY